MTSCRLESTQELMLRMLTVDGEEESFGHLSSAILDGAFKSAKSQSKT